MPIIDEIEFSEFVEDNWNSLTGKFDTVGYGISNADDFEVWRKKMNGIINRITPMTTTDFSKAYPRKVILTNYIEDVATEANRTNTTHMDTPPTGTDIRTTWTSPITGTARITCIGGGGGSGGGNNNATSGGAGGGGEIAVSLVDLVIGDVLNVFIGLEGLTGGGGGSEHTGPPPITAERLATSTYIVKDSVTIMLANPGGCGSNSDFAVSGEGGTGGIGDYLMNGGDGHPSTEATVGPWAHGGDSYHSGSIGGTRDPTNGDPNHEPQSPQFGLHFGSGAGAGGPGGGDQTFGKNGGIGAIIIEF